MKKEDIIYDHYKDTCEICRNMEKDRNKLFIYVCSLLTLLFLFIISETNVTGVFYSWVKQNYAYDLALSVDTIQSFVWIILLYFTIRYYQECICIERIYTYIHNLETRISIELEFEINREGENYLHFYPKISNFIWSLYTIIFPTLYIALITIKIIVEILNGVFSINMCLHILIYIFNAILTFLYSYFLHKDKIKKCISKH